MLGRRCVDRWGSVPKSLVLGVGVQKGTLADTNNVGSSPLVYWSLQLLNVQHAVFVGSIYLARASMNENNPHNLMTPILQNHKDTTPC